MIGLHMREWYIIYMCTKLITKKLKTKWIRERIRLMVLLRSHGFDFETRPSISNHLFTI